ncbi:MAG TPA: hypothetical protein PKA74_00835 [Bauldia sp.]|nr:hypothetical protein [Bauldia sp.]
MESWESFFVAEVGAAAVLAGLLFVGVSINLERILKLGGLPERAMQTLVLFVAALLMASLPLVPEVPPAVLGAIVLVLGIAVVVACTALAARGIRQASANNLVRVAWWNGVLVEVAAVPYVIGGIVILAGWPGGLYWIAGGARLSRDKGCTDARVPFVETNR